MSPADEPATAPIPTAARKARTGRRSRADKQLTAATPEQDAPAATESTPKSPVTMQVCNSRSALGKVAGVMCRRASSDLASGGCAHGDWVCRSIRLVCQEAESPPWLQDALAEGSVLCRAYLLLDLAGQLLLLRVGGCHPRSFDCLRQPCCISLTEHATEDTAAAGCALSRTEHSAECAGCWAKPGCRRCRPGLHNGKLSLYRCTCLT